MINAKLFTSVLLLIGLFIQGQAQTLQRKNLFDDNWKFHLDDIKDAEKLRVQEQ